MGRRKKRAKKSGGSQRALVLFAGLALAVCVVSVAVGVKNRGSKRTVDQHQERFRLEVLNGTGESGLAQEVAIALIEKNIDVFHVDNADRFDYEKSVLIARKRAAGLEELGKALGCSEFIEQLKSDAMVDATLIVGADCHTLNLGLDHKSNLLE